MSDLYNESFCEQHFCEEVVDEDFWKTWNSLSDDEKVTVRKDAERYLNALIGYREMSRGLYKFESHGIKATCPAHYPTNEGYLRISFTSVPEFCEMLGYDMVAKEFEEDHDDYFAGEIFFYHNGFKFAFYVRKDDWHKYCK